jgi:hypothetical protein
MPFYQKHYIWFNRNGAAPTYKNEGIASLAPKEANK